MISRSSVFAEQQWLGYLGGRFHVVLLYQEGYFLADRAPAPQGLLVLQPGPLCNYVGGEGRVVQLQAALLQLHVPQDLIACVLLRGLEAALGIGELAVLRKDLGDFAEPLNGFLLLEGGLEQAQYAHRLLAEVQIEVKNSSSLVVLLAFEQLA